MECEESVVTAVREFARYKLDLVGVQEIRWDKGGTARAGDYTFMNIIYWKQDFSYTRE
jgi:hypothetical protein